METRASSSTTSNAREHLMLEIDNRRLRLEEVTKVEEVADSDTGDENIPQAHTSTHSERHLKLQATANQVSSNHLFWKKLVSIGIPKLKRPEHARTDVNMDSLTKLQVHSVNNHDWDYAYAPDLPDWLFICAAIYLFILGVVGLIANGAIILVFLCNKQLQTPFNLVLMNLIMAEFVISAFGVPVDFTATVLKGWKMGSSLCSITGFILTLVGMASIYTLAALSTQRWILVSQFGRFNVQGIGSILVILGVVWGLSSAMALPPLFGWAFYAPESSGISCAPSWETLENQSYNWYLISFGFLLPLALLLFTSFSVMKTMRKNASQLQSLAVKKSAQKRENKVNLMVMVMIFSFLFCWTPYALMSIYQLLGGSVTPYTSAFPVLFCKSSICANPFIYVAMNSQFRNAMWPKPLGKKNLTQAHNHLRELQRGGDNRSKVCPETLNKPTQSFGVATICGGMEETVKTEIHLDLQKAAKDDGSSRTAQREEIFPAISSMMNSTDCQIDSDMLGDVEDACQTIQAAR
eukprot:TCALIF_11368-PC protein Name:"Similar to opn1mw4 Green-sensitive opsin-4 (Danio rerio)" AED:0.34 eAED:0.34 QI:0/0.37/0.22/0.66/0.87/0.88/9/177/520